MGTKKLETNGEKPPNAPAKPLPIPAAGAAADDRLQRIATAAYLHAASRNFQGGDPIEDWLQAELEVDSGSAVR